MEVNPKNQISHPEHPEKWVCLVNLEHPEKWEYLAEIYQ